MYYLLSTLYAVSQPSLVHSPFPAQVGKNGEGEAKGKRGIGESVEEKDAKNKARDKHKGNNKGEDNLERGRRLQLDELKDLFACLLVCLFGKYLILVQNPPKLTHRLDLYTTTRYST